MKTMPVLYFQEETNNIYRLKIPFDDIYTSVFLIQSAKEKILVDCATTDEDVDLRIIPALAENGLLLTDVNFLVITHNHIDHCGGKNRILELHPKIKIINNQSENFSGTYRLYKIKGHTEDCVGILDEKTGTLICGDGLQCAGVGKYVCSLENKGEYLKTIDKIKNDKKVKNLLLSHAYAPWNKDSVFGREKVEQYLKDCLEYAIKGVKNESSSN